MVGRLTAKQIKAYETGVNRRTIRVRAPGLFPSIPRSPRIGMSTYNARALAFRRNFNRNGPAARARRRNKASSTIAKAFKRFQWRARRNPTPFGPYSWTAKTAPYGTKARAAQNKWRKNRFPF